MLASVLSRGQLVCHCTDVIDSFNQDNKAKTSRNIHTVARPSGKIEKATHTHTHTLGLDTLCSKIKGILCSYAQRSLSLYMLQTVTIVLQTVTIVLQTVAIVLQGVAIVLPVVTYLMQIKAIISR